MGLDNGLIIRAKNAKGDEFLRNMGVKEEDLNSGKYEFGYWRKCYNIRRAVLDEFANKGYDGEGGYLDLKISDLYKFRSVMKHFLIENNWVHGNSFTDGSIWEWSTMLPSIGETIRLIDLFYDELQYSDITDEDLEIYFYDSY